MGLLIGIDEAGLGPNLGPYVVTATVWEVPGPPAECDLWQAFAEVVTSAPTAKDHRLHIGDSKAVFQPGKGIAALERGVLCTLGLLPDGEFSTDRSLRRTLSPEACDQMADDPWYAAEDLALPTAISADEMLAYINRWQTVLKQTDIRLSAVRSVILEPSRFNALIDVHQNKAEALSTVSLNLLKHVALPWEHEQILACCDKHGGRNRYDQLLSECFDGAFVFRLKESADLSVYRWGNMEVRFQPRAESQFPVAVASMVSKYLRELAMLRFNRFWQRLIRGLRPTQGYPVDARRFQEAIAAEQRSLGIADALLWRCR